MLQASQPSHEPRAFSSGNSNSYDACEFDGRCSSTAVQCNTFGNMENPRNSCNSYVGNNHRIPDIRSSCTGMLGNQIRPRLLRSRLKPERKFVLPEPEPVRLLPMEVKEVFSYNSPLFVRLRGMQTPATECIGADENCASSSFIMNRIGPASRFPDTPKKSGDFQRDNLRALRSP